MKKLQTLLATVALVSLCSNPSHAASGVWTSTTSGGTWSTPTNWSGSTVADGSGSTADFSQIATPSSLTIKMDGSHTLTNLIFGTTSATTSNTETLTNNSNPANILTLAGTTPTITVNNPTTSGSSIANIALEIDGTVGLTKAGNGTLILSGSNGYSGGTTVSAGTLQIGGSGGTTGNLGAGNVSVSTGATLTFARVDTGGYTVSNNISGSGAVTKSGNGGLLFLTGTNSYTGVTTIGAGILNIQNSSALGNTSSVVVSTNAGVGGTLELQGGGVTVSAPLSLAGPGDTTGGQSATGALENVSGTNTISGTVKLTAATTISSDAGTLNIANTTSPTGATIFGSSTAEALTLAGSGNGSVAGIITGGTSGVAGSGTLTKSGSGTWTLGGANSYTGATTIGGGTLAITGSLASGSAVAVGGINGGGATATLSGSGTINGAVTTSSANGNIGHIAPSINISGNFGVAGTLHIGGAVTLGSGTALDFDLSSGSSSGNDLISMTGTGANGVLTIGGVVTVNFNALGTLALGSPTSNDYTLISGATSSSGLILSNFTAGPIIGSSDTANFFISGNTLEVYFTSNSIATAAYFNGLGNDMNTAGNFDGAATGNSANSAAPTGVTNVFFSSNRNTSTAPNISAPLTVNSVNFGTGSGTNSGITVSSTNTSDTLTIQASTANGNASGNGITIAAGGGNDAISAPVVLGASQTWTSTDATSTLTVSGQVSGIGFALTKAGAGAVVLSNAAGNTYTGGTVVNAGTLFVNNTTSQGGSGTGSGSVTVNNGGTLAGSGNISTSAGVTINGGSTLASGPVQSGTSVTGPGLTFTNTSVTVSGTTLAPANLAFALGSGTTAGAGFHTFGTPNTNTTFLTLTGSTVINFAGTESVSLTDLTNGSLALRLGTPYLLISASSDAAYSGLVTMTGFGASAVYTLDGNGYVVGVAANGYTGGSGINGINSSDFTSISINQYGPDGVTPLANGAIYPSPVLFLNNGDLEVVPEPGTWAMMLGGLAVLVVWNRRKSRLS